MQHFQKGDRHTIFSAASSKNLTQSLSHHPLKAGNATFIYLARIYAKLFILKLNHLLSWLLQSLLLLLDVIVKYRGGQQYWTLVQYNNTSRKR